MRYSCLCVLGVRKDRFSLFWPSGKALGWYSAYDVGSILRFGSAFSSIVMVCGHGPVALPRTVNRMLKWLSSLPILIQKSFSC